MAKVEHARRGGFLALVGALSDAPEYAEVPYRVWLDRHSQRSRPQPRTLDPRMEK